MIATLNTKARDARVVALRVVTERNTDELQRNAKAPAFQSNRQNPFAQQPFAEARAMCFAAA